MLLDVSQLAQGEVDIRQAIGTIKKFDGLERDLAVHYDRAKTLLVDFKESIDMLQPCDVGSPAELAQLRAAKETSYTILSEELHKTILAAKTRLKTRLALANRAELLASLQTQAKAASGESAAHGDADPAAALGQEITSSLQRMVKNMQEEIEKSGHNIRVLERSTGLMVGTREKYGSFSGLIGKSRGLIKDLWQRDWLDKMLILSAFVLYLFIILYIVSKRIPLGQYLWPGSWNWSWLAGLLPQDAAAGSGPAATALGLSKDL